MKWRETSNRTLAQLNQHTTIHSSSLFENGRADECWLLKSNAPPKKWMNEWRKLMKLIWWMNGFICLGIEWIWFGLCLWICGGLWAAGRQWLRPKKQTKQQTKLMKSNIAQFDFFDGLAALSLGGLWAGWPAKGSAKERRQQQTTHQWKQWSKKAKKGNEMRERSESNLSFRNFFLRNEGKEMRQRRERMEWFTKRPRRAASPSTFSSFRSPAARGEKEDKSWMELFSSFFNLFFSSFFIHQTRQSRPAFDWIEEDKLIEMKFVGYGPEAI